MKKLIVFLALLTTALAGVNLDGSGDYITADGSVLDETGNISVSLWANKGGSTARRVFQFRDAGLGVMIAVDGDSGDYYHVITGNNPSAWGDSLRAAASDDVWYNIVAVVNNGAMVAAYLDGVAMSDTAGATWGNGDDNDSIYIGARTDGAGNFEGLIDEVAVWDAALTAGEAALLASRVRGMPYQIQPANLQGYWRLMDNPIGSAITGDNVVDWSGTGIDGTGVGDGTWAGSQILTNM